MAEKRTPTPVGPLFADDRPKKRRSANPSSGLLSTLHEIEEERLRTAARETAHAPIGQSAVSPILTNPTIPDDPEIGYVGGGSRPMRQSEYEAIRQGSLDLFESASMIAGSPAAPRVAIGAVRRGAGGRRPPRRPEPAPEAAEEPLAAPAVRGSTGQPGDLFDYSRLADVPDVPQTPIPRYEPARGVPARVADLTADPAVRRQMLRVIDQGERMGGREWYNVEPLRRSFIDQYGPVEGERQFMQFADLIAATSPRNPIASNVRTASYYHGLLNRGELLPEKPPAPYGSLAQGLHRQNVENLMARGGWDVMQNPKPASYAANIQGNQQPATMDTHAVRLPALLSRDPRFLENNVRADNPEGGFINLHPRQMVADGEMSLSQAAERPGFWYSMPAKNEYAALERYYQDLAGRRGMTPAQAQASAWVGGGETTGLASEPLPLLRIIENRIKLTAEQRGESPTEVLRKMIRGEAPLLSLGGLSATATLSALQALEEAGLSAD